MGQIEDLRHFVQIVELGSIGKAADQAGIAKSAMSRKLKLLEDRMQTALITRTTRQWSLTDAGREYYDRGLGILNGFDEFEANIRNEPAELSGEIRLSVPLYFGKFSLSSHLLEFSKFHPDVHLTVDFNDKLIDVINDHFDLVIRISELQDSTLVARKLCETRHVCCASPDYLNNHSPINNPIDLKSHRIIQYGVNRKPKWSFTSSIQSKEKTLKKNDKNKVNSVTLSASMNSLDGEFLIKAAEDGQGVVLVPDFLANTSINNGRLIPLLTQYDVNVRGVHLAYPSNRYLPHRTRFLIDFLIQKFR